MACGMPTLLNNIPIMREVAAGHALLVDFKNTTLVAEALETLVADEQLRERLRVERIKHARRFTFEKLATERIAAIQRLVAGRG